MQLNVIKSIETQARARFVYKADQERQDRWRSFHNAVYAGERWYGDCDDLASTVVNMLGKIGVPAYNMWFAHVDTEDPDDKIDHMLAFMLHTSEGPPTMYVIGDTYGPCYPAANMKHTLKQACSVSNVLDWRVVTDYRYLVDIK